MMTSAFFSGEILSKELMENVGTIFNIVLSSANISSACPQQKMNTLLKLILRLVIWQSI